MPPSPKDLIETGFRAGGFAAKLGLKTAGTVAGKLIDKTPFGGDDDQPFDGPAGRTESSTGRFARDTSPSTADRAADAGDEVDETPAAQPGPKTTTGTAKGDTKPAAKPASGKASGTAKTAGTPQAGKGSGDAKTADTPQAGKGSGDDSTAQGGTGGTGAGTSSASGTSTKAGGSDVSGASRRSTPKAGGTGAGSAAAGTKAAPRRISNPKAAAKARKREKATHLKSVDAPGASGKGGRPATVDAENIPTDRAAAHAGKQAAPMGAAGGDAGKKD
jgi:hypothetical protein